MVSAGLWGPKHRRIPNTSLLLCHTISLARGSSSQLRDFLGLPACFMCTSGHLTLAAHSCHLPPSLAVPVSGVGSSWRMQGSSRSLWPQLISIKADSTCSSSESPEPAPTAVCQRRPAPAFSHGTTRSGNQLLSVRCHGVVAVIFPICSSGPGCSALQAPFLYTASSESPPPPHHASAVPCSRPWHSSQALLLALVSVNSSLKPG